MVTGWLSVMVQSTTPEIPMNELGEKEFRIIWNDMIIKLGLGKERSIKRSYSKKQGDLSIEFPWGTKVEVKSADRAENLVGEGLDHVIMSEAAKHVEETWDRFIRPALSDRRGSATFSTCVVGNTLITTEDGMIEIGSLYNGEPVGSYVPYERLVTGFVGSMQKSSKFYVNGFKETIKVTNGLGSILEGTLNHPVWCIRDGVAQWVELQDLHLDDWVATRVGANVFGNNDDTSDFDSTLTHGLQKDFGIELTLNPKMMWFLGYLIGNGHVDFEHNRVSISTAEPEIISFLQKLGFKNYPGPNLENKYNWQITRKIFIEFLKYLGFSNTKSPKKVIPSRLMKCSLESIRYIIAGLFDADGTSHKTKKSVRFDMTSRRLVDQIQFILVNFGIVGRITESWNHPTDKVEVWSKKYTLEITGHFAEKFHDKIGFGLLRKKRNFNTSPNRFYGLPTCSTKFTKLYKKYSKGKGAKGPNLSTNLDYMRTAQFSSYEKVEKFLSILEPYAWDNEDWQYLRKLCDERYYWSKITKLEKSANLTFDLSIPTTHAFISNTMISHNTPQGHDWIYKLWKMGRDPNEPEFESWQFPSWDNPFVYPGGRNDPEILLTERTTPAEIFRQEYAADFTSFSGKVYSEFDEGTHVQEVKFNPLLPNYIGFDWGFAAPMAAVEFQVDAWGKVRIWREHYKTRMRLKDYLEELKNRQQPDGYHLELTFGDCADPEAIASVCEDFSPCVGMPASKFGTLGGTLESGKREGIELVQGFLKSQEVSQDEYGAPIEEPWLVIDHSCVNIINEFNNYRIADAARGKDPREQTYKKDDHALDALRYALMHIFKLGATQPLSSVLDNADMHDLPSSGYFTSGMRFS